MLRTLVRLGVAAATFFLLTAVQTGPATAADATGCRIAPGTTFDFRQFCVNDRPASSYSVAFHAPAGTAGAWSITGDWVSVYVGCGATDDYCTVTTRGSNADREVQGSKGGQFVGSAYIRWFCGSQLC
jgi:hypothetical protein